MKIKPYQYLLLSAILLLSVGCAKTWNEAAANGGLFFSSTGDYVVRNDSGGKIMDVWILHNVIVQADHGGAGYLFQDQLGDSVHLGGDCKVVRLKGGDSSQYHEYHAEFETKTYQELYVAK